MSGRCKAWSAELACSKTHARRGVFLCQPIRSGKLCRGHDVFGGKEDRALEKLLLVGAVVEQHKKKTNHNHTTISKWPALSIHSEARSAHAYRKSQRAAPHAPSPHDQALDKQPRYTDISMRRQQPPCLLRARQRSNWVRQSPKTVAPRAKKTLRPTSPP